ncbi:MAG: N-acetylneuraminate synthase family protein [Anaerolineales bacterium]|nr:N-acetylneuraminate synthase family protein [Anaerolineales bacterium]
MTERIRVGERWIGDDEPVFIIAEAGSNHNGNFNQALRLVDVAAESGADAVKFQTFKASKMYPRTAGQSDYLGVSESIYDIIKKMEMPEDWVPRLAEYCLEKKIEFISTPFDEAAVELLAPYLNIFKLASYELTHTPLVRHVASFGKPMLVSTGASSLEEVIKIVETIRSEGNDQIILCQCTASYPTLPEGVNARAMLAMRDETGCLVGLSDHSREPIIAPTVAVSLGACVIEKHFTLSNILPGPDHQFAIEPRELARLVETVRVAEKVLGHGRKELLPEEHELYDFARRSVFSTRSIEAGERLDPDCVAVLRCGKLGYGLAPEQYGSILGRAVGRDIPANSPIHLADLV